MTNDFGAFVANLQNRFHISTIFGHLFQTAHNTLPAAIPAAAAVRPLQHVPVHHVPFGTVPHLLGRHPSPKTFGDPLPHIIQLRFNSGEIAAQSIVRQTKAFIYRREAGILKETGRVHGYEVTVSKKA